MPGTDGFERFGRFDHRRSDHEPGAAELVEPFAAKPGDGVQDPLHSVVSSIVEPLSTLSTCGKQDHFTLNHQTSS